MATYSSTTNTLEYTSDGTTEVIIWARVASANSGNNYGQANLKWDGTLIDTIQIVQGSGSFGSDRNSVGLQYHGTLEAGTHNITIDGFVQDAYNSIILQEQSFGGGGETTSHIIDVGSTLMLGGILMVLIAYWMVGLIRVKNRI